jgi:hypothetical protein
MVTKIENSSNHDLEICVIGMEKYNSLGKMEETIISSRQPFLRNKTEVPLDPPLGDPSWIILRIIIYFSK